MHHVLVAPTKRPVECRPPAWYLCVRIFKLEFFLDVSLGKVFLRLSVRVEASEDCIIRIREIAGTNVMILLLFRVLL